jgi:ATP-dependent 26S proteasome regulatory subunit
MLFVGPPGTGKTLFARAAAGGASVGLVAVNGSDLTDYWLTSRSVTALDVPSFVIRTRTVAVAD